VPRGTPCVAAADGSILYSERGHTRWNRPPDTAFSLLLKLEEPLEWQGEVFLFMFYTQLSELTRVVREGGEPLRIKAGDVLGKTGLGNRTPHLHFAVIKDSEQHVFIEPHILAEMIWTPLEEEPNYSLVEPEVKARNLKLFAHDGATCLVIDDREIPLASLEFTMRYKERIQSGKGNRKGGE